MNTPDKLLMWFLLIAATFMTCLILYSLYTSLVAAVPAFPGDTYYQPQTTYP